MTRATREDIGRSLDWEMDDWRERQIDALNAVAFPQIEDDPFLKSTAWLNFGVDATNTLFPESRATGIITAVTERFAAPLWVLGQAQEGFKVLYDAIVADQNRQLNTRFTDLRDTFVRKVQDAARRFKDGIYGRSIIDQVYAYIRTRDFRDGMQMDVFCRNLIHYANLIVTDPTIIRTMTNNGFGGLCETIYNIYLGSYHAPGNNLMFYSESGTEYASDMGTGRHSEEVRSRSNQDWILGHAWQMDASHNDVQWWDTHDHDTTYVRRMDSSSTPLRIPETYRGTPLDLRAAERRIPRR